MVYQAWQTLHPPKRGAFWRRPRVHIGFHKSWTRNGLNLRVKQRIVEIFKSSHVAKQDFKLYITGALGVLLATLCVLLSSQLPICLCYAALQLEILIQLVAVAAAAHCH